MKYKTSRYNLVFKNNNNILIYNTYTGALASIDASVLNQLNDGTLQNIDGLDELLKNGFVVEKDSNQFNSMLKSRLKYIFSSPEQLHITIAPTLNCNLNCVYCFESSSANKKCCSSMSEETIAKTKEYVTNLIKKNIDTLTSLHIEWFGGEPIMAFDTIRELSKYFIEISNEYGIKYDAQIISNATLLSEKIISEFSSLKISKIQFTIDGNEDFFVNYKRGTHKQYENLLAAIKYALTIPNLIVSIRLNISKENCNVLRESLINYISIKNFSSNLRVYPAQIEMCNSENCHSFSNAEFEKVRIEFNQLCKAINPQSKSHYFRRKCFCSSQQQDNCCIAPNGDIYRCQCEIGNENAKIGNIFLNPFNTDYDMKFLLQLAEECKTCFAFPYCSGGCQQKRVNGIAPDCTAIKQRMIETIKSDYNIHGDIVYPMLF